MKRYKVTLAALLAALSFFAAPFAQAVSTSQILAIKKTIGDVPAVELAAKSAALVRQADAADRQEVAVLAVREVANQRPAAIIAVVGSLAKTAPDLSALIASEAAKLVAERATEIAKAAAAGAPAQAEKIAAAVAKVAPRSASRVAHAVVLVAPDQSSRIVEGVIASVPSSKTEISRDTTITRITERMAAGGGDGGTFTTRPGTISGQSAPNVPPTQESNPVAGADPQRQYGSPN